MYTAVEITKITKKISAKEMFVAKRNVLSLNLEVDLGGIGIDTAASATGKGDSCALLHFAFIQHFSFCAPEQVS
jgi:hypothetical protein